MPKLTIFLDTKRMLQCVWQIPIRRVGLSLAVLLMICGMYAFQNTGAADPDLVAAQQWFDANYPAPKFNTLSVTPNWSTARKVVNTAKGLNYFEVSLNEQLRSDYGTSDAPADPAFANGYVSLLIEQNGSSFRAFYLSVVGTREYVTNAGSSAASNNRFDNILSNFTGMFQYFTMDSKPFVGLRIKNGAPFAYTIPKPDDELNESTERDCWEVTQWYFQINSSGIPWNIQQGDTWIECDPNDTSTNPVGQFMPDGWGEGLYMALYGGNNGNSNTNNNNNNTYTPPVTPLCPCATYLEKPTQSYSSWFASCEFMAIVYNIDCNAAAFSGDINQSSAPFNVKVEKLYASAYNLGVIERSVNCNYPTVKIRHYGNFLITVQMWVPGQGNVGLYTDHHIIGDEKNWKFGS